MTLTAAPLPGTASATHSGRFRLHRAGVLNVWQYDEQEFTFAGGRLLLRGANGAGKSKTLEMLLPFALDGDKARITASAKHHTSLLWLMTDGYEGQARVGYVWVEFVRIAGDGEEEAFTCGVGIRASASARTATAWHFTTSRRVGRDLFLEDEAGPMSRGRLEEVLGAEGHVFEKAAAYKEHVGRALFGLDAGQYDEVLRLLYWLRQPQVGEDIEPAKLAQQLSQALPQLDEPAVRSAGDTFDELSAFGEQIERRAAAAESLGALAAAFAGYARAVVAERARTVAEALRVERRLRTDVKRTAAALEDLAGRRAAAEQDRDAARADIRDAEARLRTLEDSPEFRDQRRLSELHDRAERDERIAEGARARRHRQTETAHRQAGVATQRLEELRLGLSDHSERLRELCRRQRQAVPGATMTLPTSLDSLVLQRIAQVAAVREALKTGRDAVEHARSAVGRRLAGVGLVRSVVGEVERAAEAQHRAEMDAERAEARWEAAREASIEAEQAVAREAEGLWAALAAWAEAAVVPVVLPEALTEGAVATLPGLAHEAVAPERDRLHRELARSIGLLDDAEAEIARLSAERATVEAQRDPAPPAPVLPRTDRGDEIALWQAVDFAPGLDEASRAGVEAALQSAGLLDALVRRGGLLLEPGQHDVILAPDPGGTSHASTLGQLLVPDVPPGLDVSADDVRRVLNGIGNGAEPSASAWIARDGSWRLGPAHGRAEKERAQYVGATARAHERARRLAALDAALEEQRAVRDSSVEAQQRLEAALGALAGWVDSVPSGGALLGAWARHQERSTTEEREELENRRAQDAAHDARTATAVTRARLERVAAEQELPHARPRLDAVEQELRVLDGDLRDALGGDAPLVERLTLWEQAVAEADRSAAVLAEDERQAAEARDRAAESQAELDALRASVGDTVEELQRRITDARRSRQEGVVAAQAADEALDHLLRAEGEAEANARNARDRLGEQLERRAAVLDRLSLVAGVPGLLEAAGASGEQSAVVAGLGGQLPEEPVGRQSVAAVEALTGLTQDDAAAAVTRIWRSHGEAVSGPAADHQLVVAEYGDLVTVTGRDDAGEAAVVQLAHRVAAGVERDRALLTEREKRQFEQHVLGELGDAIRRCRRDAEELVTAMNDQLGKVSTSQGIRVRLSWKLREDVPAEARAAVELLAQPVGALIPEERATLRDVLHRLIEASRAESPELSYAEHLSAALDYRTWAEFTIRYTRPERPGHWERLHRRSALSQGEQKVLCYLPLFAAAAAHFTSLAGAAPHAPRLVLLDDAFPKIDVRTHPLLFGLLVQLDLDFVITSERLWGDHETVPSLAVYEALRDPNQRGIAQYEYRWDGRALHALG